MDISTFVREFAQQSHPYAAYDAATVRNLLTGSGESALVQQEAYENPEYLAFNIRQSVSSYARNKDVAIRIYKDFLAFLKQKGIHVEVQFPPVAISNTFERLMFIARYLQDPRHKVSDLPDRLWVSRRTIEDDLKRLRGNHDDPIQICGKVFQITELERSRDTVHFPSTAPPLFLTPNLSQVLAMLKGLKLMGDDPLYAEYARLAAADIWEQLSDYAKSRILEVLTQLLPEDTAWYTSLQKADQEGFYSEYRCSTAGKMKNIFLHCLKNSLSFCMEYEAEDGTRLYRNCRILPGTYRNGGFEAEGPWGRGHFSVESILRCAYTAEELA